MITAFGVAGYWAGKIVGYAVFLVMIVWLSERILETGKKIVSGFPYRIVSHKYNYQAVK